MFLSLSPRRRGETKRIVLVILFVIVVALSIWFRPRAGAQPGVPHGLSIAERFLQELREGHPEQAWAATTAGFQHRQGREEFIQEVQSVQALKEPLEFEAVEDVMVDGLPRSEYLYRATSGANVRIVLAPEGMTWKVDRWVQ